MRAYDSHQLKAIFEVATLDLKKVALSFGFTVPPVVDLSKLNLSAFTTNSYSYYFINFYLRTRPQDSRAA